MTIRGVGMPIREVGMPCGPQQEGIPSAHPVDQIAHLLESIPELDILSLVGPQGTE